MTKQQVMHIARGVGLIAWVALGSCFFVGAAHQEAAINATIFCSCMAGVIFVGARGKA